jgi:hypothetical protein
MGEKKGRKERKIKDKRKKKKSPTKKKVTGSSKLACTYFDLFFSKVFSKDSLDLLSYIDKGRSNPL